MAVPAGLRPMLNELGCNNDLALSNLTGPHVDQLEAFAQKHLARVSTVRKLRKLVLEKSVHCRKSSSSGGVYITHQVRLTSRLLSAP